MELQNEVRIENGPNIRYPTGMKITDSRKFQILAHSKYLEETFGQKVAGVFINPNNLDTSELHGISYIFLKKTFGE